ncbi:uncharacterized protein LOC107045373 [Diachasma alloeum]|uniref:uncharacterized protein LOC107045373 n=1 Tax=Diachasma alloeum TaxID=454923 RepID=UPI0007384D8B|nr:uncharacterized protein LOC107045373 [Diachasma alloeum]
MDLPTIDVSTCINIVTKILSNLSQYTTKRPSKRAKHYCHIDIELIPQEKYCWVQITNNGEAKFSLKELLTLEFSDPTLNGKLLGEVIMKESKAQKIYKTHFDGNLIELRADGGIPGVDKFSHLKDYLSIKIEHPIQVREVQLLVDKVVEYLNNFQTLYPQTKYTLRSDRETFYNNFTEFDDDYAKCEILSSALETVVLQSVNEDFRREVCETLDITDVNDTLQAIMCHLLPILHKNYQL